MQQDEELCDSRYRCLPCTVQCTNRAQRAQSAPVQRVATAGRTTPTAAEMVEKTAQQQDSREAIQIAAAENVGKETAQQPVAGQAITDSNESAARATANGADSKGNEAGRILYGSAESDSGKHTM